MSIKTKDINHNCFAGNLRDQFNRIAWMFSITKEAWEANDKQLRTMPLKQVRALREYLKVNPPEELNRGIQKDLRINCDYLSSMIQEYPCYGMENIGRIL